MLRLFVFLVLAALCTPAVAAHAQGPLTLRGGDSEVSILADQIEESGPDRLVVATGNVEITRGATRLSADRVELNRATGDAVASGRVIFYDGQDRLSGSRFDYNINTGTGVAHDADAFSGPYYRLGGERMERLDDAVYRVRRGVFTTCEDDPPTWSVHMESATADFDSYLTGHTASFWVKRIPVIPFIPFFAAALRRERQTGFLFPTVGSSTRKGAFAKVPFYWAISDSTDLTVSLDGYSERGIGGSAEYRYVLAERHQGVASGFFIHESALDDEVRGAFRGRHSWTVDPSLSLKADINHVSDDDVFREYGDRLSERSIQRAESNVFLTKRWSDWNFVGNLSWYQDLTTPRPTELQRLPDLRLTAFRQPVPGIPGLLWEFESSGTHFVRDLGSDGSRVDLHPRAVLPFRPLNLFTVAPFVGARVTGYDRRVTSTESLGGGVLRERTADAVRARVLGEAGADFELQAARAYQVDTGGIARLLHLIEPRVNYTFTDGVNKDDLPRFDEIDALGRRNRFTYSLTNRLAAKTTAGPDETPVAWELARFVVANTFDADAGRRPFGNVTADLIVHPNRHLRLRADAAYNPYAGEGLRSVNSDVSVIFPDGSVSVGTRFTDAADIEFYRAEATARVTRNLALRGAADWDAERAELVEARFGADLLFQCWAVALTYVRRAKDTEPGFAGSLKVDHEVRVSLDLLGVGTLQTSRGLTP